MKVEVTVRTTEPPRRRVAGAHSLVHGLEGPDGRSYQPVGRARCGPAVAGGAAARRHVSVEGEDLERRTSTV
jgi:hypothetical protein